MRCNRDAHREVKRESVGRYAGFLHTGLNTFLFDANRNVPDSARREFVLTLFQRISVQVLNPVYEDFTLSK